MNNKQFVLNAFMGTRQTIVRLNTQTGVMQLVRRNDPALPLNKNMDYYQFIEYYIQKHHVHEEDAQLMREYTKLEVLRERCERRQNGTLLTFRRIENDGVQWSRVILTIPEYYCDEKPEVMLSRRDMEQTEADFQDVTRVVDDKLVAIIKCDFKTGSYRTIKLNHAEDYLKSKYHASRYTPGSKFIEEEFVHPADLETFRKEMNYSHILNSFSQGAEEKRVYYRRKSGRSYRWVKLTILPAAEYTREAPVFMFLIEDVNYTLSVFFAERIKAQYAKRFRSQTTALSSYYDNLFSALSYFTRNYADLYMIDLSKDTYIKYKMDNAFLQRNEPQVGPYSEMANYIIEHWASPETAQILRGYDTSEKIRQLMKTRTTIEYEFPNAEGRRMKTVLTKLSSSKGVPAQVMCSIRYAEKEKRLKVTAFGSFEVYSQEGRPLKFRKKQSKQLLAYLIDKHGYPASTRDIMADVLEKPENDLNARKYVSALARMAAKDLELAGYPDIILRDWDSLRVNVDVIDCDYYHLLEGDNSYLRYYHNEYMKQYSWAEETNAEIQHSSGI